MAVEAENVPFENLKEITGKPPNAPKFIPADLQAFLVVGVVAVFPLSGPWHDWHCRLSLWRMLIVTTKHLGNVTKNRKERLAMLLGRFRGRQVKCFALSLAFFFAWMEIEKKTSKNNPKIRKKKIPQFFHWKSITIFTFFWFHAKIVEKNHFLHKKHVFIYILFFELR